MSYSLRAVHTIRAFPHVSAFGVNCPLHEYRRRYDAMRYIYERSKADKMASSFYRTGQKQKKLGKTKNKNRLAQKKRYRQKSVEAVREEEVELRG